MMQTIELLHHTNIYISISGLEKEWEDKLNMSPLVHDADYRVATPY